jgi:hypothetical protein
VTSTYHSGLPPAGRDGFVLGYAALPEYAFERGIEVLADFLAGELA